MSVCIIVDDSLSLCVALGLHLSVCISIALEMQSQLSTMGLPALPWCSLIHNWWVNKQQQSQVTRVVVMINALSEYTHSVRLCSIKEDPWSAIVVFNRCKFWKNNICKNNKTTLGKVVSSVRFHLLFFSWLGIEIWNKSNSKYECQKKRITLNLLYKVVEKIIKTRNKRRIVGEDLDL